MKKKLLNTYSFISLGLVIICLAIYIYFHISLTPELTELTPFMMGLSYVLFLALPIIGIYHIVLFVRKLKSMSGKFFDTLYLVIIIISGIMLLSDITLLSDIGKEYLLFDVTIEWIMLYCLIALHLAAVIISLWHNSRVDVNDKSLFQVTRESQEALFLSLHQIGLICGIAGIFGAILAMTGLLMVPQRFRELLMFVLSILALCPLGLMFIYWLISMRKRQKNAWVDEKQRADTGVAAVIALIAYLLCMLIIAVVYSLKLITLPLSFWLLTTFFVMLTTFSIAVISRNN